MDIEKIQLINEKVADFIQKNDLKKLPLGKYEIDPGIAYVNIEEYLTKTWDSGKFESHKRYMDIQMVLIGKEIISTCSEEFLTVFQKYIPEKDIMFFNENITGQIHIISENNFLIIPPLLPHRPSMSIDNMPQYVKKAVFKVYQEITL